MGDFIAEREKRKLFLMQRLPQKLIDMVTEEFMEAMVDMVMVDTEEAMEGIIEERGMQKLLLMQRLPQTLIDMVTEELIEAMVDMAMEDTEEVMEDIIEERGMQKLLLMQRLPQQLIDMVTKELIEAMEAMEAMEATAMEDTEGAMVDTTVANEMQIQMLEDMEIGDNLHINGVNSFYEPKFTI